MRRAEQAVVIALAAGAGSAFLWWLFAGQLPTSPRPGPDPGGLWSFFFQYDGAPAPLFERLSDAELRRFLQLVLDGAAVNGVLTVALVVALAWRGYGQQGGRTMALALVVGTISTAHDNFIREFALRDAAPALRHACDLAVYLLDVAGYTLWYRFLRRFPAEVKLEDLAGRDGRLRLARVNASIVRRLDRPRFFYPFMACVCAIDILAWMNGHAAGAPTPLAKLLPVVGTVIVLEGLNVMVFNGRHAVAAERRFEWIYLGFWYGVLAVVAATFAIGFAGRALGLPAVTLLEFLARLAFVSQALFVALLALTVFYQGALDARHVIRRTALIAFLGMAVGALFIVAERFLAFLVVRRLTLPEEWAWILAGGVAALALGPLRRSTDRALKTLVDRLSPPTDLADGERGHAAVVFSDLSGFTALSARDERSALIAASLLHKAARDVARLHSGRLVKTIGDAVLLEFGDAAAAVAATNELHSRYAAGAATLDLPPLAVHSGIHAGDVLKGRDGDIYGATVNLAARLQDAAQPGEIVASAAVSAAAFLEKFRWHDLGEKRFKNVPQPVACARLVAA